MDNVGVAFIILPSGEKAPPVCNKSSSYLVLDVKMDFTGNTRWVNYGHRTPDPTTSSYTSMLSHESIIIAMTYAALMVLDAMSADIINSYLQAPISWKNYVIFCPEFVLDNVGKLALIKESIYSGKVAGREFWRHLRTCLDFLGFASSLEDPGGCHREETNYNRYK